jgi:hypothetical protein
VISPMPKPPTITERKLGKHGAHGLCWSDGTIEIDSRLRGKKRLEIVCHEIIHHLDPEWSEAKVLHAGRIMGNAIWKQGYRKTDS